MHAAAGSRHVPIRSDIAQNTAPCYQWANMRNFLILVPIVSLISASCLPAEEDPVVRANLIFEPFAACALSADEMGRGAYVDVPGIVSVLIAGGVTIVSAVAISKLNLNHTDWTMLPFGVGAAGLLGVIIVMSFSGRRRIRKLFLPRLRHALKPLNPTREDLEPFWPQLKGHILGKSLKMEDLVDLRY